MGILESGTWMVEEPNSHSAPPAQIKCLGTAVMLPPSSRENTIMLIFIQSLKRVQTGKKALKSSLGDNSTGREKITMFDPKDHDMLRCW